jgi:hypothetical protein
MTTERRNRRFFATAVFAVVLLVCAFDRTSAQVAGEQATPADSVIMFIPVVPLIGEESRTVTASQGAGLNILLSGSGWAFGGYYVADIAPSVTLCVDAFVTPRRNSDEFDDAYYNNITVSSVKRNRVFLLPLSVSMRLRLFEESLQESFRPYVTLGITASGVIVTPYLRLYQFNDDEDRYYDFFESFKYAETSVRPGGFIGIGSSFGSMEKGGSFSISARYYVLPYPEPGVESTYRGYVPAMTELGGFIIMLSIGSIW